ncbi:hypothetical protein YA0089_26755 [Pseudomonas viridiflava]|uniref:hypothetical protein n=1 Tax=Pseudomonas viridiflava TaxID=33069 RepID=UPI0018E65CE4|nr:hypothetical protein [Pseudomonas viridiflava]MBI6727219.1 hypothetical protein [Pseudomonas viridiflava]
MFEQPEYVIKEYREKELFQYHYVTLNDDRFHPELTSINAFRQRLLRRMSAYIEKNGYVYPSHYFELRFAAQEKKEQELLGQLLGGPPSQVDMHHNSIFDFYTHIGFDYKKNKWPSKLA